MWFVLFLQISNLHLNKKKKFKKRRFYFKKQKKKKNQILQQLVKGQGRVSRM
jgi:hypothetical protein